MMGTRERLRGGEEFDALTKKARRIHRSRAGKVAVAKRPFWRRVRRETREALGLFPPI